MKHHVIQVVSRDSCDCQWQRKEKVTLHERPNYISLMTSYILWNTFIFYEVILKINTFKLYQFILKWVLAFYIHLHTFSHINNNYDKVKIITIIQNILKTNVYLKFKSAYSTSCTLELVTTSTEIETGHCSYNSCNTCTILFK